MALLPCAATEVGVVVDIAQFPGVLTHCAMLEVGVFNGGVFSLGTTPTSLHDVIPTVVMCCSMPATQTRPHSACYS